MKLVTFGYKKQSPPKDAVAVIDCRKLPNPWVVPSLRDLPGDDEKIIAFLKLKASDKVEALLKQAHRAAAAAAAAADVTGEGVIAFGCHHGRHRSVAMKTLFEREIKKDLI